MEARTAHDAGIDTDRLSFSVSIQVARLTVVRQAGRAEVTLEACLREAAAELQAALLPNRRHRRRDRAKKQIKNTFESRKRDISYTDANVRYTLTITKHPPQPAVTRQVIGIGLTCGNAGQAPSRDKP